MKWLFAVLALAGLLFGLASGYGGYPEAERDYRVLSRILKARQQAREEKARGLK